MKDLIIVGGCGAFAIFVALGMLSSAFRTVSAHPAPPSIIAAECVRVQREGIRRPTQVCVFDLPDGQRCTVMGGRTGDWSGAGLTCNWPPAGAE